MTKVLVTGSRNWTDSMLIWHALSYVQDVAAFKSDTPELPTLIHGDCPDGADLIAKNSANLKGWTLDPHPADWKTHGKRAGYIRNAEMVALKPDVCLAFLAPCVKPGCPEGGTHPSHGGAMTARLAETAGIYTIRFEVNR